MICKTSRTSLPSILVTNVDSPLGHSIIRNISHLPFRDNVHLYGLQQGDDPFGGEHLCDALVHRDPKWDSIDLSELCKSKEIGLIIPTTEQETVSLKESQEILPFVLASPPEVSRIFLDKAATAKVFDEAGVSFCPTFLPSEYAAGQETLGGEIIVKPRRGEHSSGIVINPSSVQAFPDEHFVVQPLMKGTELTTAIYFRSDGSVHGSISFVRRFVPQGSVYEVTREHDSEIELMAKLLRSRIPIVGSINMQSIVVDGEILPFEVNGRISSSNVIRAALGFGDVQWGIEEYLFHKQPSVAEIKHGSALNTRVDIIYPNTELAEVDRATCYMTR